MTKGCGPEPCGEARGRAVLLAAGALGVAAVMTQLAMMRELLGAFSGNELVFGIALGSWLLLTGAGAWTGRVTRGWRRPWAAFALGLGAAALLPPVQVAALRLLRDVAWVRGAAVGVPETVLGCLVALAPFCLVSGALLTLATRLADSADRGHGLGRIYVADTVGGLAGGVLFSFALIPWLDHIGLLGVPAVALLGAAATVAWQASARGPAVAVGLAGVGLPVALGWLDLDGLTTAWQHGDRTVLYRGNSPYGRLVVTREAGQVTFFENGAPVITGQHIEQIEETAHYALSQRPEAREVLLIGGGVTGTAREILRHGVTRVTYVELDPQIVAAGRRFFPGNLDDPRIEVVAGDGRRFTQLTRARYDVVIVALPAPSTLQLNRFYTAEFVAAAARALRPDGVLSLALGHYANYVSPELGRMLASAHRTLRRSFAHVRMIPGGRIYFLASNGALTLDIAGRLEARGLTTQLVHRRYLETTLSPDRLADLERAIAGEAAVNADFSPSLHSYHQRHWLSQFAGGGGWLGGALLGLLAVYGATRPAIPRAIVASGFAASALGTVLLIGFQALYGSVYRQVGLMVTLFMAGLAAGAWGVNRPRVQAAVANRGSGEGRWVGGLGLTVAGVAAALPFLLGGLGRLDAVLGSDLAGQTVVGLTTLVLGGGIGAQFALAGRAEAGDATGAAARLYAADLFGAAGGALLASTLLIPRLGVLATCLLTAGLNLAAAALLFRQLRRA